MGIKKDPKMEVLLLYHIFQAIFCWGYSRIQKFPLFFNNGEELYNEHQERGQLSWKKWGGKSHKNSTILSDSDDWVKSVVAPKGQQFFFDS